MPNVGDVSGLQPSATAGSFFIALYTDNPTDADIGTEATYTSYARASVDRSVLGFLLSGSEILNADTVVFPTSTGVTNTITYFGVRTALTGGDLVHYGILTLPLVVNTGNTPKFEIGDLTITED